MCLILWSWQQHSAFPLVLAANRDEFYDRPAAPAAFWIEAPQVLAGRDLVGGGTWMGVTREGRWAALTNFRDPSNRLHGGPSRGLLVRDYLLGTAAPEIYLREVAPRAAAYAAFNLLAGDRQQLFYFGSREGVVRALPPGLYGMSNGLLDTSWPKVESGKAALAQVLAAPGEPDREALFALLADSSRPPDQILPDTGVGLEWERVLSSRFIASAGYGTRSSTLLLFGPGDFWFAERTFQQGAAGHGEIRRRLPFSSYKPSVS